MGTNTGLGIGIGIPFKNNALGGDKPYFPPELKARMIGVWTNYGKKNTDADRNIIKNKIPNAGGDLEILNAAYKLNSGFGEYKVDFLDWTINSPFINERTSFTFSSFNDTNNDIITVYQRVPAVVQSFKIKAKLRGRVLYRYYVNNGDTISVSYYEVKEGINILPDSADPTSVNGKVGFVLKGLSSIKVELIPNFEDAFVTDGINDIIASIKTLEEWNIGNKGITIVSMIHQINTNTDNFITTNNIRTDNKVIGRNIVSNIEKTGIYGWYKENIQSDTINVINNILGDKNDYTSHSSPSTNINPINNSKFYVQGYAIENGFNEISSIAHYWTFAVLGKATEDEINLIIGNYNLDRSLKPDILCNIGKQGITNDNHADFNDKLIDYSGNGRDIQMYNLAWKGGSGIAAKKFETIKDYNIIPDEGLQELTIYNEFSFKIKSIRYADRYWAVQSLNKTDMSYPVTIITDKDIIWRNTLNYTDADGVKGNVKKETNVPANTPTQVFIYGFNDFDISDDYTKVNCVAYATRKDITEFTVTFIPSYKGGLLLDGVNDFGKVTGMPIYKDYTIVVDYERISGREEALISKAYIVNQGAFVLMETSGTAKHSYSFGAYTAFNRDDFTRTLLYQSKYKCGDVNLTIGKGIDGDTLWLGTLRNNDYRFFNGAIYSLMSFPYSMSEFLIERQLKKHKLGTLYPDMVEFRPVIKSNASYDNIVFYYKNEKVENGTYLTVGSSIGMHIRLSSSPVNEIKSITINGIPATFKFHDANNNIYQYDFNLTSKSPQKINITIDEYIRFEDIVQPYPVLLRFKDENGNEVSWGDKIKVGSTITRIGSAADSNLLPNIYNIFGLLLNGNQVTSSKVIVEKTMVFKAKSAYIFDNNEPKCILSPRLLRIPNSSYKILGYIPDISGHGNHGKINNSAYAEGSGVNEDGSYQFDGVDDFVTIPTVTGGKQVLMKVNWDSSDSALLYDQRGYNNEFAICNGSADSDGNPIPAYSGRNNGQTYIDGILNSNIKASELRAITHNITITNELSAGVNKFSPVIGSNRLHNAYFVNMALYDFMLFDEISTDDKIKELNKYIGIEAKVELPPYYWDAYGKTNSDADRDTIQQRGIAVGDYDLTNYNHAYEGMSGYNGYPVVFGANKTWTNIATNDGTIWNYELTPTSIAIYKSEPSGSFLIRTWVISNGVINSVNIPEFKIKISNLKDGEIVQYHYISNDNNSVVSSVSLKTNGIHTLPASVPIVTEDVSTNKSIGFTFKLNNDENVDGLTIEVLPEYENGLVYNGVSDFSYNTNIETTSDFTFLVKALLLKGFTGSGGCIARKGDKDHYDTGGYAFIYCFDSPIESYRNSYYSFGKSFIPSEGIVAPPLIGYMTKTSVNGVATTFGTNSDMKGILFGNWANGYMNMVIYKSIFYTKTISLLEINFLKNLMEKNEIIDLNNPIFIKNE